MGAELDGCEPLSETGGANGILLLHGFTGCPQSLRPLARRFVDAGYTVELPLLPGHGTTEDDLSATRWADWAAAADQAYTALAGRCERVVVAGLSMGAALTVWLAGRHPEIAGIVCVNPVVDPGAGVADALRQMLDAGTERIPAIGGDIADPDGHEVAYHEVPLAPLLSLAEAATELRALMGRITSPLLLLTSPQDHVVPPENSDELAAGVAGPVERVTLERSYHVATLDYDAPLIEAKAVAFADRVTAG